MQKRPVTLCGICGCVGLAPCLVTCTKCHKAHEHIYCMRTKLSSVPEIWFCEVCQLNKKVISESSGLKGFVSRQNKDSHSSQRLHREKVQYSSEKKKMVGTVNGFFKVPASKKTVSAPPQSGKVKFISAEDINAVSSGAKMIVLPTKVGFNSGTTRTPAVHIQAAPHSSLQRDHAFKSPGNSKPLAIGSTLDRNNKGQPSNTLHKQKSLSHAPPKLLTSESSCKRHTAEEITSGKNQVSSSNGIPATRMKKRKPEVHRSSSSQNGSVVPKIKEKCANRGSQGSDRNPAKKVSLVIEPKHENPYDIRSYEVANLTNPPAIETAWKGEIELEGAFEEHKGIYKAHHSEKISRKVYEFTKGLPQKMMFLCQSSSDVWPAIFSEGSPSAYDIALYFLPCDVYRYEGLQNLVKKHNICLRYSPGNADAELLIFSSQRLPPESQKFNQKFYLWGIFRSKKRCTSVGKRPLPCSI